MALENDGIHILKDDSGLNAMAMMNNNPWMYLVMLALFGNGGFGWGGNRGALYVTMCMIDSDSGRTIARMMGKEGVATNDTEYFAAVFGFAMDKLEDEDRVFNIRRYFKDILWPER